AAALGGHDHVDLVARHDLDVDHARGVVLRVDALAGRVGQHAGAQLVVRVRVGPAHALVDHVLDAHGRVVPAHVHADLEEYGHDARVLADRPVPLGAHARVDQDLRHRVLGRRRLLPLPGGGQRADVVDRVVVADVL